MFCNHLLLGKNSSYDDKLQPKIIIVKVSWSCSKESAAVMEL